MNFCRSFMHADQPLYDALFDSRSVIAIARRFPYATRTSLVSFSYCFGIQFARLHSGGRAHAQRHLHIFFIRDNHVRKSSRVPS